MMRLNIRRQVDFVDTMKTIDNILSVLDEGETAQLLLPIF